MKRNWSIAMGGTLKLTRGRWNKGIAILKNLYSFHAGRLSKRPEKVGALAILTFEILLKFIK